MHTHYQQVSMISLQPTLPWKVVPFLRSFNSKPSGTSAGFEDLMLLFVPPPPENLGISHWKGTISKARSIQASFFRGHVSFRMFTGCGKWRFRSGFPTKHVVIILVGGGVCVLVGVVNDIWFSLHLYLLNKFKIVVYFLQDLFHVHP